MNNLTLEEMLVLELEVDNLYLEMKFTNEILEDLIKRRQVVDKETLAKLIQLRWLSHCRSN